MLLDGKHHGSRQDMCYGCSWTSSCGSVVTDALNNRQPVQCMTKCTPQAFLCAHITEHLQRLVAQQHVVLSEDEGSLILRRNSIQNSVTGVHSADDERMYESAQVIKRQWPSNSAQLTWLVKAASRVLPNYCSTRAVDKNSEALKMQDMKIGKWRIKLHVWKCNSWKWRSVPQDAQESLHTAESRASVVLS